MINNRVLSVCNLRSFLILISFQFLSLFAFSQTIGGTGPNDDFDGDGIINSLDIDDDNDGVLDITECGNIPLDPFDAIAYRSRIMRSSYHGTIFRSEDGKYFVTGASASPTGNDLLTPLEISVGNGYNFTGSIMHAAAFDVGSYVLLTTDGLFTWGTSKYGNVGPSGNSFGRISLDGINPLDVKSISVTSGPSQTLYMSLLMNDGTVYIKNIYTGTVTNHYFLNGAGLSAITNSFTKVLIAPNTPLTGITHVELTSGTAFAFNKITRKFYTWGRSTYLGNGSDVAALNYATEMTSPLPTGVEPLWIQINNGLTYYVLGTNGKVYTVGRATNGETGQGNTTTILSWAAVKNEYGTNDLIDVAYLSAQNATGNENSVSVILKSGKVLSWGSNNTGMIGMGSSTYKSLPTLPDGILPTDKVWVIENGGHIAPLVKDAGYLCQSGHNSNGAFGDGTLTSTTTYTCFAIPFKIENPTCNPDTDNDGIRNSIDLDSDNDGCNDAIEGAGYPLGTIIPVEGTTNSNYGANGFVNSKETTSESGIFNGIYSYPFATSASVNYCSDFDNDGIFDYYDLDDDNDGILDQFEQTFCDNTPSYVIKNINGSTIGVLGYNSAFPAWMLNSFTESENGYRLSFDQPVSEVVLQFASIYQDDRIGNFTVKLKDGSIISGLEFNLVTNYGPTNTIWTPQPINTSNFTGNFTKYYGAPFSTGTPYFKTTSPNTGTTQSWGIVQLKDIPGASTVGISELSFSIIGGSSTSGTGGLAVYASCNFDIDTDNDGIPNRLDLDSDGDGCTDAAESGTVSLLTSNTVVGPYDNNGFANSVETTSESGIYSGTYTYYLAKDATQKACIDSDGDGVLDIIDIDDDNDGVTDITECNLSGDATDAIFNRSNIISGAFHGAMLKDNDNKYYVYGQYASSSGSALLSPVEVTPANGYSYSGKILMGTAYGLASFIILTNEGLYTWGETSYYSAVTTGTATFRKIALPLGISPYDIKSISATMGATKGLAYSLTLKNGKVITRNIFAATNGTITTDPFLNGAGLNTRTNDYTEVVTTNNIPITGITHTVMSNATAFAFNKLERKFYTWGYATSLGDGTASASRNFATEMINPLPSGVDPLWIQVTSESNNKLATYYILGSNGRVYTTGNARDGQTGQGNTTDLLTWGTVKNESGTQPLENVEYLSAENAYNGEMNASVILSNGKLLSWGSNNDGVLKGVIGTGAATDQTLPKQPDGIDISDKVIVVENGGHITPIIKEMNGFSYICNVGHNGGVGAFGDGTTADRANYFCNPLSYTITFSNCNPDTDGDGIRNTLDIDSDNDGCNDAIEAAGYPLGTVVPVAGAGNLAYGANGLVNNKETFLESGSFNAKYTYSYAINAEASLCVDTDNDGVMDYYDYDDDNDGILDHIESPSCFYSASEWSSLDKSKEILVSSDLNTVSSLSFFNKLIDGQIDANALQFSASQIQAGKEIFKLTFNRPTQLSNWYIVKDGTNQIIGTNVLLQGSYDNSIWTDLSVAVNPVNTINISAYGVSLANSNKFSVDINLAPYKYYRLFTPIGTTGSTQATPGIIREFYFDIIPSKYVGAAYPKSNSCTINSDGDNLPNHLDLDSDGDGCADAAEAGTVASLTINTLAGPYDGNGFANSIEINSETGIYSGSYNYMAALDVNQNACTDSDSDGVNDLIDIDDDNDGVLDDVECDIVDLNEYRNKFVTSGFHGTIWFGANNSYYVAGSASDITGTVSNATPIKLIPENGYTYTGKLLATQAFSINAYAILTTDGLWLWGEQISPLMGSKAFQKVALPNYINPVDIKKMSINGYNYTISFLMKDGSVYTYSNAYPSNNGAGITTTSNSFTKVISASGLELRNITHIVTHTSGTFAYSKIDKKFYTWGNATYLGNGTAIANRNVATEMQSPLPSSVNVVDIRLTGYSTAGLTYFVLGSDKRVYSLGYNNKGQVGIGSLTATLTWNTVKNIAGTGPLENVEYLSAQHASETYPSASVILTNGQVLSWGQNDSDMIGTGSDKSLPTTPNGIANTTKIYTLVNGGHLTPVVREDMAVGNVGHNIGGAFGDGTTASRSVYQFFPFAGDIAIPCKPDSDGDGIPNRLDLDSDNDGCNDAIEGAGYPVGTIIPVEGINNTNYGSNGFVNTKESSSESGIYNGMYTYSVALNNIVNSCIDTDADGIADIKDLDDDNDGILDHIESPTCYMSANEWSNMDKRNYVTVSSDLVGVAPVGELSTLLDNSNTIDAFRFSTSPAQSQLNKTIFKVTFDRPQQLDALYISKKDAINLIGGTNSVMFQGSNDNTTWTNLWSANANPIDATNTTVNGGIILTNSNKFTVQINASLYRHYRIYGTVAANIIGGTAREFYFDVNNSKFVASAYPKSINCLVDTDNDGISNQLDLDSDGDGCSDASESKTVNSLTASTVNGSYGNNGFANSIEIITESGLYSGTYSYGYALDGLISVCKDTDADGVPDEFDLDDDNDGILDTIESPGCNYVAISNDDFGFVGLNPSILSVVGSNNYTGAISIGNGDGVAISSSFIPGYTYAWSDGDRYAQDGQYAIVSNPRLGGYAWINENKDHTTLNSGGGGAMLLVNGANPGAIAFTKTINNLIVGKSYKLSAWLANLYSTSGSILPNLTFNIKSQGGGILATNSTGPIPVANTMNWTKFELMFNATTTDIIFELVNNVSSGNGNDFALDDIQLSVCNNQFVDTDGDGIPNQLDLDSDGDGCSDANEAYVTTTAQGTDGNQYYGTNPITVDATGKVIGATYSSTSVHVTSVGSGSTITAQPTDQSVDVGGTAIFATTITAGTGTTTYQWQVSPDGGTTWNNVTNSSPYTGGETLTLTVANVPLTMKGYRYRLNISQSNFVCGNVTSYVARLLMDNIPIVVDDNTTGTEDTPINGNVLSNDKGSGNPTATLTITNFKIGGVTYTAGQTATIVGVGTIIINANGIYTFTPTANYNGTVPAIDYIATDTNGGSDFGTLYLSVTSVNDAPIAVDDNINTNQNIPVSGNILTDGTDDIDADGNLLSVNEYKIGATSYNVGTTVNIAGVGTIVVNSNGSYTFTPVFGYTGSVPAIDYTIGDGNGGSDIGRLSINVVDVNDAPLATDDILTIYQNNTATGNLLTNDADVDVATTLTITQYSFTIGGTTYTNTTSAGIVTIPGVGTINITDNGAYTFVPTGTFTGTVPPITYTLNDGALTDNALLDIFVQPVNINPIANDDVITTNEDTPVSGNVLTDGTDDSDADGNSLTVTEISFTVDRTTYTYPVGSIVNIPVVGTIIVNTNGIYTFTPLSNYNGTVPTISYTISDGHGGTAIGNLNITISATNDNPIAVNDDNKVTPEDTPVTVNVLTNDSDPDGNTTLVITQFTIAGITGTFTSSAVIPGKGTLTALPNGDFIFTPDLNFNGVLPTITYTVSDGTATNTANLNITVTPVNDLPTVTGETPASPENTPISGNLLTNDTDVETGTASLTVTQFTIAGVGTGTAITYAAGTIVDIPNVGSIIVNANGTFTFTPVHDYFGTVPSITYTVSDGQGGLSNGTLAMTVTPVNDPPIVVNEAINIQEDIVATGNVLTNDSDQEGNPLSITQFSIAGISGTFTASSTATIPGVGTVVVNTNGTYTFTPTANYNGIVPVIEYTVSDGQGASTKGNLTIVVGAVNDAPLVVNDVKSEPVNTPIIGNVLTNDRDVEAATLTVTNITIAGVSYPVGQLTTITGVGTILMNADGSFTFTPALNYVGTVPSIGYTVTDGTATSLGTLSLTITPIDADGDGIPDAIEKGSGSTPLDTDNDGTPDYLDTDSDGDGILDNVEDNICIGFMPCTPTDTDGDGTPDYKDLDSDGDGISDAIEGLTDTDGDSIPNYRDTDSDGDGILDSIEKGPNATPVDTDNDGTPNYLDLDSDGDGISDAIEGIADSDNDGTPDNLDVDSDGDGIPDSIEKGTGTTLIDTDGDGTPNFLDTDSDGDGILDNNEDNGCTGTAPCTPTDTDGDGTPDYLDLDSDNDGILDSIEKGSSTIPVDTDNDGTPDFRDLDSDGDGIVDAIEKGTGATLLDTDGDGTPNYLDTDSDGDGIPDSIEKGAGSSPIDTDGDGVPDYLDIDSDGDGILDNAEDAGCTGTAPCTPTDTDGDGIPNYKDLDSDGDGITDVIEKGANGLLPLDTDSDGTPDYVDTDSDGDGISDAIEKGTGTTPIDTDGDGIPDYRDTDSDDDGITDAIEKGSGATPVDTDGDGIPDFRDNDSDADAKTDKSEGNIDTDGDNSPNYLDEDSDGDGVLDAVDLCPLVSGLGSTTGCPPDSDGDGLADVDDADDDNDGILDSVEAAACSPTDVDCDTDGDGIPNRLDKDSDGDGINDLIEAGGTDANNDGIADGATDSNGVPGTANGGVTPPNTDGTGNTNPYDLDSDGDGISDTIEKGTGATLVDTDGDGTPDYLDVDCDDDGIADAIEKGTGTSVADTENDGIPDFKDVDSDGDGIPDATEKGPNATPLDSDGDGVLNFRDLDSDGDGILDSIEDAVCTGVTPCAPTDTDTDGTPDYLDADSDGDGIPDTIEKGIGSNPLDTDGDGTPDYLDTDSDGDGILDSVEDAGCTGITPCTPTDTDGDGTPDYLDVDSDGDGIPDTIEKGTTSTPVDTDGDNIPDYLDVDSDGDGIPDNLEDAGCTGTAPCTPTDTDGDGIPNYLDIDSDGDNVPDTIEKGTTTSPVDTDSDGIPDYLDTDTDGDGIPDSVEDAGCAVNATTCTPTDTDGDGIPNHKDLDSDGDGIPDSIEKGTNGATPTDTDGTGLPDYLDTDSDGDGISDAVEKGIDGNNPLDTDGDGIPDYKDTDSDNDGIPDSIEKGTGATPLDTDGDGIPDYRDSDSDGDGILDNTEDAGCTGTSPCTPTDTDNDGIPNYRDLDSDGDNKTDLSEGEIDYDGDNTPNYLDTDADGDGVLDNVDMCPLLPGLVNLNGCPVDADGDGVNDTDDADDDNDGILDTMEATACVPSAPDCDTDGDGIPNRLDPDSDNDGIPDVIESNGTDLDSDGKVDGTVDANGVPNSSIGGVTPPNTDGTTLTDPYDTNSDGDGISDIIEKGANGNNPVDTDGDGIPDYRDADSDNDGIPDNVERGSGTAILDTDGDGTPDYKDLDSDGDGILDATEGTTDTDGDGIPNYRDIDSDGDGISDAIEKGTSNILLDTDGDGTPNYLDVDSDGDGISDAIEKGLDPNHPIDTDGDGKPDYLDTDSDNDGIPDSVEKGSGVTPIDSDGDVVPDYRDTDSDGDGILDAIEDDGCTGTSPCTPTDTDGDGIPNYLDVDTDGDGKLDAVEKGPVSTPMDSDRDGIPDYRDVDNLGNADVNVTNINTAVTGNLKTNDEVPVGTTYKQPATNTNNPTGATLVVNADGTYSFTATTPGKYIYYVPVCGPNQINGCPISPLEITVLDPLNTDKPVANNDFATITQGTPITLNVLANDRAGDSFKEINPSTLTVTRAPKHGTAVVNNDGTITYTPSPYFVGSDSLQYQVCDNNNPAQCQTAVAYFKIEPTGVTPVTTAADDYISTVASATGASTLSGTVLLNDQNSGGGNLTATLISGPSTVQGTLVFNSYGTYSFTPAAGFIGPINIVYEVCGGSPVDCAKATLHVLVNPQATLVNDAANAFINIPVAGNIATNDLVPTGTTYGTPVADPTNPAAGTGGASSGAVLTMAANGTYTFTATVAGTYTYTVPVCASGQTSNCPTETIVFTVPVNTLVNDAANTFINIPVVGNIATNDLVPTGTTYGTPVADPTNPAAGSGGASSGAVLTMAANGTYTFTATVAGTYTYTIPVCAPGQTSNCPTETIVFTVPVNTLMNDSATAYINIPTTGNISSNDVVPTGTTFGIPVADPTNPAAGSGAASSGAVLTMTANGTYTFTATVAGTYTYTVPVCAPGQTANCPTETIVFTVPVNTLVNDTATAYINIAKTGNIASNDLVPAGTTYGTPVADPTNPAAGSGAASTGAVLTMSANGTYTFTATVAGTYSYTVPVCAPGQISNCPTETIVFTVIDNTPTVVPPIVPPVVPPIIPPVNPPITKVLDVTKVAGSAVLNLNGSFDITFTIKAFNLTNNFIDSVLLKDDLTQVFNNPNDISVVSVTTSGGLVRNPNYNGISNTDLVTINSSIVSSGIDSVLLRINVPSSISGNFQNTVVGSVSTPNGFVTTLSTDPTRIISVNDTVRKPTLFAIPKVPLNIPEGFSPNNDGIDDTWVIRRPFGTKVSVWVINRWGNEVYKQLDYKNDWNGKSIGNVLGEDLPEGTYYYIVHGVDLNGKLQKLAGSLTIIR